MPPKSSVPDTRRKPTDTAPIAGYDCSSGACIGVGLSDLLFHQLQDATNKANQRAYTLTGGAYIGPSIAVNGIIDVNTVNALAALSASGIAPTVSFYDVHLTPQFVADNAQMIVDGLNAFLGITYQTVVHKTPTKQAPVSYQCADGSIVADAMLCTPIPTTTPPDNSPPIIDPAQLPQPITFVPEAQVVGLSRKGAIGLAVIAVLVGAFVGPRLFAPRT